MFEPALPRSTKNRKRRRTVMILTAAVILIALAAVAWVNRDTLLVKLFGPPSVSLSEAYEEKPDGPKFDHSTLSALLSRYVDEHGWVDYDGLQGDAEQLDRYIESVAQAPFDELGRNEKLALLINAYNAFTLKLILEHYPVASIQDIPSSERWDDVRWKVGENRWSLTQIENEQIRPKFREPRIHFALVCAAVGCPPLRNEAYLAERLDEQLQEQSLYVHSHKTWLQFDREREVVRLTKLYLWYGGDFEQVADSVLEYAARFAPELQQYLKSGDQPAPRIEWLRYDWSLNGVQYKTAR